MGLTLRGFAPLGSAVRPFGRRIPSRSWRRDASTKTEVLAAASRPLPQGFAHYARVSTAWPAINRTPNRIPPWAFSSSGLMHTTTAGRIRAQLPSCAFLQRPQADRLERHFKVSRAGHVDGSFSTTVNPLEVYNLWRSQLYEPCRNARIIVSLQRCSDVTIGPSPSSRSQGSAGAH